MAVKIQHGTVVCVIGQLRPLAILQHKSRRAICLYELASLSQNSDDFAFIPGVVDENVDGDTIAAMLSDQHGHAIDDINKHIVLKKDCGNAVADFELLFLVHAEGTGENENGIGQHGCADKRAKRNRCAGNLHRAQTDCLHHREFTVGENAVKNPVNRNKGTDWQGNCQPKWNNCERHQDEIRKCCAPADHHFEKADCLEQPDNADDHQGDGTCCPQQLRKNISAELHVLSIDVETSR